MPVIKRYDGRIVTRMEKTRDGQILLTFKNPTPGKPRERLTVTQAEWDARGKTEFVADASPS